MHAAMDDNTQLVIFGGIDGKEYCSSTLCRIEID